MYEPTGFDPPTYYVRGGLSNHSVRLEHLSNEAIIYLVIAEVPFLTPFDHSIFKNLQHTIEIRNRAVVFDII